MKWLSALLAGLALLAVTDEGKAVQGRRPQSVVIGVVKDAARVVLPEGRRLLPAGWRPSDRALILKGVS